MRFRFRSVLVFFALMLVSAALYALPVVPLKQRVTDQTGVLSAASVTALEDKLQSIEQETGAQLAILLIDSLEGEPIESYSMQVAEAWKLGRKGIDDGVLILVALNDRKMRIEVGYGLEGVLTDAACQHIIDEAMAPSFRIEKYDAGLEDAADRIATAIRSGEYIPPAKPSFIHTLQSYQGVPGALFTAGPVIFLNLGIFTFLLIFHRNIPFTFMFFFLLIFWAVFPLAFLGFTVFKYMIVIFVIGVPLLRFLVPKIPILSRISDGVTKRSNSSGGGRYSGSSHRSGGGFSRGSSGGGFSGGGGSFGGGGASGSW